MPAPRHYKFAPRFQFLQTHLAAYSPIVRSLSSVPSAEFRLQPAGWPTEQCPTIDRLRSGKCIAPPVTLLMHSPTHGATSSASLRSIGALDNWVQTTRKPLRFKQTCPKPPKTAQNRQFHRTRLTFTLNLSDPIFLSHSSSSPPYPNPHPLKTSRLHTPHFSP
jgi:hypothetical protein